MFSKINSINLLSNTRAVTGGTDGDVHVWDLNEPKCDNVFSAIGSIFSICTMEDDRVIAASPDQIQCWSLSSSTPTLLKQLELPEVPLQTKQHAHNKQPYFETLSSSGHRPLQSPSRPNSNR